MKLWERRDVGPQPGRDVNKNLRSWFGGMGMNDTVQDKTYTWYCRATFEPKSEAVREIKWSKFNEDSKCNHTEVVALTSFRTLYSLTDCFYGSFWAGDCQWIVDSLQYAPTSKSNSQDRCAHR